MFRLGTVITLAGVAAAIACTTNTDCASGEQCYRPGTDQSRCIQQSTLGATPTTVDCTTCVYRFAKSGGCQAIKEGNQTKIQDAIPAGCASCGEHARKFCQAKQKSMCDWKILPLCAADQSPDTSTGCPSCKKICTKEAYLALPECASDAPLERNASTGCPNCRRATNCTTTRDQIPTCLENTKPQRNVDGCPSCKLPPLCTRDQVSQLDKCADGVKPTRDNSTRCPSCLPPQPDCSAVRCAAPPDCEFGEMPKRAGCCVTCKPKRCTDEQKAACKESMSAPDFPECNDKEDFFFDNCCFSCKPPKDVGDGLEKKCTKDQFKKCAAKLRTCRPGQKPEKWPGKCCPTCKKASRNFPKRVVAKCKIPVCNNTEPIQPESEDGTFSCPSCRPARPACPSACTEKQICGKGKCVRKKIVKMKMTIKKQMGKAFARNATAEEIKQYVVEAVDRFCDNPANADRCKERVMDLVKDIRVRRKARRADAAETDPDEFEIDVPEVETTARRRLTEDDAATLVEDALGQNDDPDIGTTANPVTITTTAAPQGAPDASSATAIGASVLATVAAVFQAFF